MNFEFEKLNCEVTWTLEGDSINAIERIRRAGNAFDFAIVDLFYRDHPAGADDRDSDRDQQSPDGLDILKELYRTDARTFTLLVTSHGSWLPGYREMARPYCTQAIDRDELRKSEVWGFGSLARKIYEHVVFAGLVDAGVADFDLADTRVAAILGEIGLAVTPSEQLYDADEYVRRAGLRIVRNLVMRCLDVGFDESQEIRVSYVAEGRSGAHVCRVDLSRPGRPPEAFILKFSLDRVSLRRELDANLEAQRLLSAQGMVSLIGTDVTSDSSGYHAVIMRVATDSMPLSEWLRTKASREDATRLAEALFGELLGAFFKAECQLEGTTAAWLELTPANKARVESALEEYEPVIGDVRAGLWRSGVEFRLLRDFLADTHLKRVGSMVLPTNVQFVKRFGDLHGDNVLVQGGVNPRPVLIDASHHGSGHWASDAARLLVDLFLRVRRPGIEAVFWDDLPESVVAGERLCPASYQGLGSEDGPVEAFISHVVLDATRFTGARELRLLSEEWHWQWHAAMAKEFLRQARHIDLTPPRAVLALILGARHLRWSMALLRRAR